MKRLIGAGEYPGRIVIHICLALTLLVQPAFSGKAPPDKRFHLPTYQQIKTLDGEFTLKVESRIVLKKDDPQLLALLNAPRGWGQKIRYATGFPLEIVVDSAPMAGDIVFDKDSGGRLAEKAKSAVLSTQPGNSKATKKNIGSNVLQEGYLLAIGKDRADVTYVETTGALRALQSLTLMLMADGKTAGKHRTIGAADVFDYPLYENRRIMLDVARFYLPTDQLIGIMDKMSMHKLNELHLHLNDSVREMGLGDLLNSGGKPPKAGFFRLYNEDKPRPDLWPSDGLVYTKKDWAKLETAAHRYGIKIIPEFDAPGHAMAFAKDEPKLKYAQNKDTIDTSNAKVAVDYFTKLIMDFRPWFKSDTIHIGGDEAWGNKHVSTVNYINGLYANLVKSPENPEGFEHFWIWYEAKLSRGKFAESINDINKNINIAYWLTWDPLPTKNSRLEEIRKRSAKWIDGEGLSFYVVPKLPALFSPDGIDPAEAYASYGERLKQYQNQGTIPDGIQLSLWNDVSKLSGLTFDEINATLGQSIAATGLVSWRGLIYDGSNKVVPINMSGFGDLLPVSQEMSSYWVRDRFPYFDGGQALQVLLDASRHLKLQTLIRINIPFTEVGLNLFTQTTYEKASWDWMAWDMVDMANAFRGPKRLDGAWITKNPQSSYGGFVALELPGEGNGFYHRPGFICRDIGFALGERKQSACNADYWKEPLSVPQQIPIEKSGAGTLKLAKPKTFNGSFRLHDGKLVLPRNSSFNRLNPIFAGGTVEYYD
jgi:hexosaminidase